MVENINQFELEIKFIPKKEMYITTSDGEKYRIKEVIEMLTLTTDGMCNSVLEFNVTRKIKPSTVNEVLDVNGAKFEVYRGDKCFITTQSYKPEDLEEIANIWEENNHEE